MNIQTWIDQAADHIWWRFVGKKLEAKVLARAKNETGSIPEPNTSELLLGIDRALPGELEDTTPGDIE